MIRSIIEHLNASEITLYHGSKKPLRSITVDEMVKEREIEGFTGLIFYTSEDEAKKYGRYVCESEFDLTKKSFISSKVKAIDKYRLNNLYKLVDNMEIMDEENFQEMMCDFNVCLEEASEKELKEAFKSEILEDIAKKKIPEFHYLICEFFGSKNFLYAWNKVFGKDYFGVSYYNIKTYDILNTSIIVNAL